ncbi:MAG: phenylalanine--tRNA ligase subunit beta [Burkholderiales bacterium]|nr:phenylalanine--tRNA ligase subunit beta [Burkholderiales bacterium]
MRISWNYLQSLFEDKLDKALVLDRLTMAGLEVEDEMPVAPEFSGIVVGEVIECEKHPDADKLSLCKIDAGTGELLQIICGAPNVKKGVKAPCAKVGAILPGDFKIAERKMRGLVSFGMMCGGDEIGCPDGVDGLLLLSDDAPVGMDIREYLDLNDTIVEFKITPNRGDCLSYAGLAREIAALTDYQVKPLADIKELLTTKANNLSLDVKAINYCQHYVGLEINNVRNDFATPTWLVRFLERSNIRSISPIVDITNFILLRLGQPLHAFDTNALHNGIGVRMSNNGEKLKLLDGKNAELKDNTMIIVNGKDEPVAIAGVMGGLDSGVVESTTNMVLESAYFVADAIAGKTKQYGVSSDAAFRYERGVDSSLQHKAANLAAQMIVEICGGEIGGYVHFAEVQDSKPAIKLTFSEINRLVGEEIAKNSIANILTKLGCTLEIDGDVLQVTAPSYRFDLNIKQDIIEEIIRVYGYDNIQASMPILTHTLDYLDDSLAKIDRVKSTLVGYGFNEVINYAFIEDKYADMFSGLSKSAYVKLQNPIAGLGLMRNSLLPGLVKNLQANVNRGQNSIRIFEMAKVFHGESSEEQAVYLSGLIYGKISALNWYEKSRNIDFYDLKVVLEELILPFGDLQLEVVNLPSIYHPGRSAQISLSGQVIGFIGQLHPEYIQKLGLDDLPYVFELNMDLISSVQNINVCIPSKFQKVSRDLAFVLDKNKEAGAVVDVINELNISELIEVKIFDVFMGGNLTANQKSIAINLMFHADRTLSDDEITSYMSVIQNAVKNKLDVELR